VLKRKTVILILCLGFAEFGTAFLSGASGRLQSGQASSLTSPVPPNQDAPKKMKFELGIVGEGRDEDGVHLGFSNYKASDGIGLIALYTYFSSAEEAQNYFQKQLAEAAKVIERKKKLNSVGKVVGERAQILKRVGPQKTSPAVLWTDGITFHEIYSSSLEDILELEKVYKYTVHDSVR
jgi:hypothetical protein